MTTKCKRCNGSGQIKVRLKMAPSDCSVRTFKQCPECKGLGKVKK